MNALFVTLVLIAGQPSEATDAELAEMAHREYLLGVEARGDARAARPHFAAAADAYRALWERGPQSPELAESWARVEFLAGDLPRAIAAAHAGLRLAPHRDGLQRDLETYRDAVIAMPEAKPDEQLRPPRLSGVRARVSEWDLLFAVAAAALVLGIGAIRRFTVGGAWALPIAVVGIAGLIVVGGLAWKRAVEAADERAAPVWVLRSDETLRKGNGESHGARVDAPLPRGAEVREITHRGGWLQVRLAGGAIGWLPERTLQSIP